MTVATFFKTSIF